MISTALPACICTCVRMGEAWLGTSVPGRLGTYGLAWNESLGTSGNIWPGLERKPRDVWEHMAWLGTKASGRLGT